jgi:hypothetical protein
LPSAITDSDVLRTTDADGWIATGAAIAKSGRTSLNEIELPFGQPEKGLLVQRQQLLLQLLLHAESPWIR